MTALLLDRSADVNAMCTERTQTTAFRHGITPLLYVTWFSPTTVFEMVALLVDNGADINARDNDSITPLYYAVISEEVAVVALLLDRGAAGSIRDAAGRTACRRAQRMGAFAGTPLLDRLCPT